MKPRPTKTTILNLSKLARRGDKSAPAALSQLRAIWSGQEARRQALRDYDRNPKRLAHLPMGNRSLRRLADRELSRVERHLGARAKAAKTKQVPAVAGAAP